MNLFLAIAYERGDSDTADAITEALEPPNKIDSTTGLPFGWDEEDELDGLGSLLAAPLPVEGASAK